MSDAVIIGYNDRIKHHQVLKKLNVLIIYIFSLEENLEENIFIKVGVI